MNHKLPIAAFVSTVLAIVCAIAAQWTSMPWCDELVLTDAAVNFLRNGNWFSNVWPNCYNPLHLLLSAAAIVIFGAHHLVVTSLGCFWALLASFVILGATRRRGIFKTTCAETFFVCLFWTGWYFVPQIVNGRPDMLTLLLFVWLLDAVLPSPERTFRCCHVVLRAALLTLTSVYTLPLALLIVILFSRKRAFCLVGGFAIGGALTLVFYAFNHELIRFFGWLVFFNTITGECSASLWSRLLGAYLLDPQALVMFIAALIMASQTSRKYALLIALIPALMTLSGRYQPYYAWIFYVPVCILFASACEKLPRIVLRLMILVALGAGFTYIFRAHDASQMRLARQNDAYAFVSANAKLLQRGTPIIVAEDILGDTSLYYPLLARRVDLWFRGPKFFADPSDKEKFTIGLSRFVADPTKCAKVLDTAFKFQSTMPTLPSTSALVVFASPTNQKLMMPILEAHGFRLTPISASNGFALYQTTIP